MASPRRDWYLANLGVVRYIPVDQICEEVAASAEEQQSASTGPAAHLASPVNSAASENDSARRLKAELNGPALVSAGTPPRPEGNPVRPLSVEAQAPEQALIPGQARKLESVPVTPAQRPQEQPFECRLGFWQASDRVAVLSAMPAGQRPTAGQLTMLTNLLKAIKCLDSPLSPVDLIDWPQTAAIGLQGMARDLKGARDFVSVFLQAKARLQPFSHVLLMGDMAARVATDLDHNSDSDGVQPGQQFDLACGARGIVTRSLHEMERNPGLKGETWQAIKFLADS